MTSLAPFVSYTVHVFYIGVIISIAVLVVVTITVAVTILVICSRRVKSSKYDHYN